jgi:hypothetical protein
MLPIFHWTVKVRCIRFSKGETGQRMKKKKLQYLMDQGKIYQGFF